MLYLGGPLRFATVSYISYTPELTSVTTHTAILCDTKYEKSWYIESTTSTSIFLVLAAGQAKKW